jgi:protocatechuate 3,4-dioxygenase, alpha subunit
MSQATMGQVPGLPNPRSSRSIVSPYCTIGPFFPFAFVEDSNDLTQFEGRTAGGQRIWLGGTVVEGGNIRTVDNTILEIWQPDANGIFRHPLDPRHREVDPGFFGWGRARTDHQGLYRFRTVLPGRSREIDGTLRCAHANLMVLAIGITRRLVTTVFFSEAPHSADDPVLRSVPESARHRLFARKDDTLASAGLPGYRFDIVLRGENETPFFLD